MIYIRLDVELRDHERILESVEDCDAGVTRDEKRLAVYGLFAASLSYCQEKRLDGEFPKVVAGDVLHATPDLVARLVRVGLWSEDGTRYRIRNFVAKNDTRDKIDKRIADTADRQARSRSKRKSEPPHNEDVTRDQRVAPVVVVVEGAGSDLDRKTDTGGPAAAAPGPGTFGMSADEWADGVRSVTGTAPTLTPWDRPNLEKIARSWPDRPLERIRADGADYATRQLADSGMVTVKGYCDWATSARPKARGIARGRPVQSWNRDDFDIPKEMP